MKNKVLKKTPAVRGKILSSIPDNPPLYIIKETSTIDNRGKSKNSEVQ